MSFRLPQQPLPRPLQGGAASRWSGTAQPGQPARSRTPSRTRALDMPRADGKLAGVATRSTTPTATGAFTTSPSTSQPVGPLVRQPAVWYERCHPRSGMLRRRDRDVHCTCPRRRVHPNAPRRASTRTGATRSLRPRQPPSQWHGEWEMSDIVRRNRGPWLQQVVVWGMRGEGTALS